jgi:hypothetical protein
MFRKIIFIALVILSAGGVYAQTELTLPYLESVYQASYINPAVRPANNVSLGLPGISSVYSGITNSGFTFNQATFVRNDSLIVSPDKAFSKMGKQNFLFAGVGTDLFHLRVKARNMFFSLHAREHIDYRFNYPKDFFMAPWKGNGAYIGKQIDWSGLSMEANHYREYAIGWSDYNERKSLSYGGRVKFLQGLGNINWKNKKLGLTTSEDFYALDLVSEGQANTSLPVYQDEQTDSIKSIYPEDQWYKYFTNFKNKGFGIDLGAEYEHKEKWIFTGSLTNIGFITWKTNPRNYRIEGATDFKGFDPVEELYKDSTDWDAYADSLANKFNYTKTRENYTTWLAPRLYLAAKYKLLPKTQAGLSVMFEKHQRIRSGISLGLNQQVGRWFETALTYSVQYKSWNNLGFAFMLKPGPFQIYFATDHIFRLTQFESKDGSTFSVPADAKFLNFRFGINLVFGKIKTAERQPLPGE